MSEVLFLLTDEKSYHGQELCSAIYSLVSMQHSKMGCLLIVNDNRHLFRELEYILVIGHSEGALWLLKSLELHEIILRDQQSALDFRHEDTSTFHA